MTEKDNGLALISRDEVLLATPCSCGHLAIDHHGTDGRQRRDAGCHGNGSMREDWCRCPRTCGDVVREFGGKHAHGVSHG